LNERTLKKRVEFRGKGLHSGEESYLVVEPAEEGSGIIFHKYPENIIIPAHYSYVSDVNRGVTLSKDGAAVRTVEHLLSALWGLEIDNAKIILDGPEIPALDGSSKAFCEAFHEAGVVEQDKNREYIEVRRPVNINSAGYSAVALPSPFFEVSYAIHYQAHPVLSYQYAHFKLDSEVYLKEISKARTYVLEEELNEVFAAGLAKGGSLDNAVVVTRTGFEAKGGLNYADEPVRHKILDFVGDIALLGKRVKGKFILERTGHKAHLELVKEIDGYFGGKTFSIYDILKIMPHRYPFLLVDRIESLTDSRVVGVKNVTMNEPFFQGHFPEFPVMPGVLIIEAMAQVGGFLLLNRLKRTDNLLLFFAGIDNARFRKPVKPGDSIVFEVELVRFGGKVAKIKGVAKVSGDIVAEAELMAQVVELQR
jgi:UDP-3-O-[3-hydroxymyristoyl] N-acetylglucosamine deacetylase/3-hydroxyacyl-[acyl-carrier-protein] dehydratase